MKNWLNRITLLSITILNLNTPATAEPLSKSPLNEETRQILKAAGYPDISFILLFKEPVDGIDESTWTILNERGFNPRRFPIDGVSLTNTEVLKMIAHPKEPLLPYRLRKKEPANSKNEGYTTRVYSFCGGSNTNHALVAFNHQGRPVGFVDICLGCDDYLGLKCPAGDHGTMMKIIETYKMEKGDAWAAPSK